MSGPSLSFGRAKSGPSTSGSPQFLCLRCRNRRWRPGGVRSLTLHLRDHDLTLDIPDYQRVDETARRVLGADGKPTKTAPDESVHGWVRTSHGPAYITATTQAEERARRNR